MSWQLDIIRRHFNLQTMFYNLQNIYIYLYIIKNKRKRKKIENEQIITSYDFFKPFSFSVPPPSPRIRWPIIRRMFIFTTFQWQQTLPSAVSQTANPIKNLMLFTLRFWYQKKLCSGISGCGIVGMVNQFLKKKNMALSGTLIRLLISGVFDYFIVKIFRSKFSF